MSGVPAHERGVAMVLQDHPLFPHLDVSQNLAFGLRMRKLPGSEIQGRVTEVAALLGLTALLDRRPQGLSGGERQRVALGMALAKRPALLLLDEPLAHLDSPLRLGLRGELRRLQRQLGLTVIHVTHDQAEAMALADRLAVLHAGELLQAGTPHEVYRRPINVFVAQFLGMPPMNLVAGRVRREAGRWAFRAGDGLELDLSGLFTLGPAAAALPADDSGCILGIRPEDLSLAEPGEAKDHRIEVVVDDVEWLGADAWVRVRAGGTILVARAPASARPQVGSRTLIEIAPSGLHSFSEATGRRL